MPSRAMPLQGVDGFGRACLADPGLAVERGLELGDCQVLGINGLGNHGMTTLHLAIKLLPECGNSLFQCSVLRLQHCGCDDALCDLFSEPPSLVVVLFLLACQVATELVNCCAQPGG